MSAPRFKTVGGAQSSRVVLDREPPLCSFCGLIREESEQGVAQGDVSICGVCIDKAREIAGRE